MTLVRTRFYTAVLISLMTICTAAAFGAVSSRVQMPPDAPVALFNAAPMGRLPESDQVPVTFTFALRNQAGLDNLLGRLYDPTDALYGKYLSTSEFAERFGPSQSDYDAVAACAVSQGLTVTGTHSNRLLLDVSGPRDVVEKLFAVHLLQYKAANGRIFYSPDQAASLPATIAEVVSGVIGLSTAAVRHPDLVQKSNLSLQEPSVFGSGPGYGLDPTDISTIYGLGGNLPTGSGQTMAVFELDGYNPLDILHYEQDFNLPRTATLQPVLVDGANGRPGTGAIEVTLDIELQLALAPGVNKILVYEAPNTDTGEIDCYSKIAEDNTAKEISSCWGLDEQDTGISFLKSENTLFQQMAAQGQSIFAASGDNGAYDGGTKQQGLRVDDPASQPYVCGVGGTTLSSPPNGLAIGWYGETTWNTGSIKNGASGGGVSSIWPIPSWQQAAITSDSGASTTMRNVPDVSLNADPSTGYSIYFGGQWSVYGGTSCAAPLWAGISALVNQERSANGESPIGLINPSLYPVLKSSSYPNAFHDIDDGSNNFYYTALTGYDDATGLGTPNIGNLLPVLAPSTSTTLPIPPFGPEAVGQLNQVEVIWETVTNATSYNIYMSETSGTGYVKVGTATSSPFIATNVAVGTRYYFVVTSVNSAGQSAYSGEVSAIPAAGSFSPPNGVTVTASNASVDLSWEPTTAFSSFNIYRGLNASDLSKIANTLSLSYTDTNVTNGVTYFYAVSTVEGVGESVNSRIVYATPTAPGTIVATYSPGINFISLPYDYSSDSLSSVLGYNNPALAVWNPSSLTYAITPNAPADRIRLGEGYWVRFPQIVVVTLKANPAVPNAPYPIQMVTGWNQFGDPFPTAITSADIQVVSGSSTYSFNQAVSAGLIGPVLYSYDTATGSYVAVEPGGSIQPLYGYYFEALANVTLEITDP